LPPARPPRRSCVPDLSSRYLDLADIGRAAPSAHDEETARKWPAWTDVPVEHIDYDAFDDDGNCTQIQEEEAD
jgi:hypothetical protein